MRRPRLVLLGVVLCACVLASCGRTGDGPGDGPAAVSGAPRTTTSGAESTTTTAAPHGLVGTIGTNRLFQPRHQLGLGLANVGDTPLEVTGLRLRSPLFTPVEPSPASAVLEPTGRRLVFPLPYGEPVCGTDPPGPRFRTEVMTPAGPIVVDATEDHEGALERLHARECAAAEVRAAAELGFGPDWSRDGTAVAGSLLVTQRQRGRTVTVDDATGNVIFTLRLDASPPLAGVDDESSTASVPVVVSADRCDPHAVAEFKRPMVFLAWVSVDGGPTVPVEFEATGDLRRELEDVIASC